MRKIIEITESEAVELTGKEYTKDMYFNPVQDEAGCWLISKEEVDQCSIPYFDFLKNRESKDYIAKASMDELFPKNI